MDKILIVLGAVLLAGVGGFLGAEVGFATPLGIVTLLVSALFVVLALWTGFTRRPGVKPVLLTGYMLSLLGISLISIGQMLRILESSSSSDFIRMLPLAGLAFGLYAAYFITHGLPLYSSSHQRISQQLESVLSGPPLLLSFLMAIPMTCFLLLLLAFIRADGYDVVAVKFLERGVIPPLTLALFLWGLLLLLNKFIVLLRERHAFFHNTAHSDIARSFAYLNTVRSNESMLHRLDYFLDLIWKKSSDFYIVPRYINWAIPILGFIGTVLGISLAADGIQKIIGQQQGLAQMSSHLGDAIAPLGIAFDTTLIALSFSVVLVLIQTSLQRWEDRFLIDMENDLRLQQQR